MMGNGHIRRTKLKFIFWILLAFLAIASSMNILLLGNTNTFITANETDLTNITSAISLDIDDKENTIILAADNANEPAFEIFKVANNINLKHIISISSLVAVVKGFYFNILFIVIFIIYYLNLFKSKPDDWTLINQKVRLDD